MGPDGKGKGNVPKHSVPTVSPVQRPNWQTVVLVLGLVVSLLAIAGVLVVLGVYKGKVDTLERRALEWDSVIQDLRVKMATVDTLLTRMSESDSGIRDVLGEIAVLKP